MGGFERFGRGLPVAGYTPRLAVGDLLVGLGLGLALAGALWWSGHPVVAAFLTLGLALAASAAAHVSMEETWVGDDWMANRFLGAPVVLDADAVEAIDLPACDAGLSYLVFRGGDRRVRIDIGELFRRPALARATLEMTGHARRRGAEVDPGAAAVLEALDRRLP